MPVARRTLLGIVIGALVVALAVAITVGLRLGGAARPAVPRVILLTIDTLRADALPIHGNRRVRAPVLSALAGDSVVFEQAWAASPWTRPSVVSFLTGLSAGVHGADERSLEVETVLPDTVPTLAECLGEAGYRTAAIGFNPFVANSVNVRRGFRDYWFYPRAGARDAAADVAGSTDAEVNRKIDRRNSTEVLTRLARHWIREHRDDAFFLWLHYFDPHFPYMPPASRLGTGESLGCPPGESLDAWIARLNLGLSYYLELEHRRLVGGLPPKEAEALARIRPVVRGQAEALRALYEAEIACVDAAIGRVVDLLKELDLYDDTLIVVTSDHGEEFLEHGNLEHGHALYEEVIRVPLLVKRPGPAAGAVVRERVSNQSVFSTVLDLCGIPVPAHALEAPSLRPRWGSDPPRDRPRYLAASSILYGRPGTAIVFGDHKYVFRLGADGEELYDLSADPTESKPLGPSETAILRRAREHLADWNRRRIALRKAIWTRGQRTTARDEETRKLLESLGYLK